jgi:hypothetical protein
MSVSVVYRESSEHARDVADFLREFERNTGQHLETLDPDTREGADVCRLYDIVEYPSVIATNEDGQMRNIWRGQPLPTINEVSYYVQ